ncbi:(S)-benzoin forming benzil reductase [Paenibacillus sp. SI8]|uniref:(S)-benzoin forming benzil reductase n=1 Tax=unclassified Paenibacillus TaxID=185978 RepID=UPI003466A234
MKYFILTGTSRGLGEAMAKSLISSQHHLFCISRNKNEALSSNNDNIDQIEFDLDQTSQIEEMMEQIFSSIDDKDAEGVYLINNAAILTPLSRIEEADGNELSKNLHVNLLSPIILTSSFIRFSKRLQVDKRVLNISSASARHLLPGMSAYSAAKAGLDIFTKCVGVEQGVDAHAVKVVSVWPGMIDTSLQEEARHADKRTFPAAEIFGNVKDQGMLASPASTAEKILSLFLGDGFAQGAVVEELFA